MRRRSAAEEGAARPAWMIPTRLLERTTAVVITLAMITGIAAEPDPPTLGYVAYALAAAGVVLARRRWLIGLVLVVLAPLLAAALGSEPITLWSVATFTAFVLALRGAPALVTGGVTALGNLTAQWVFVGHLGGAGAITPGIAALTAVAATAVGSAVRDNNRYWLALEERTRDAEASRELVARRSVAEERLRIARDLHDSVGHAVAVVSMRLGAAEVQLAPGADGVRTELVAARVGVQEILREMQQILHVLRIGEEAEELTPTPGASSLPDLVQASRAAGLPLEADLGDLGAPLPADVDAATYRIVQEALTNAHRHGAGEVRLRVAVGGDERGQDTVHIEVENALRTAPTPGLRRSSAATQEATVGGHGLVGMRERAHATGGRLETRVEAGRFLLHAELPVRGGAAR